MNCIKYRAGSWVAIARSSTLVVLPAGTSSTMIDNIWTVLAEGPDIEKTLRSVTAGFGSDPTVMPGFAIAVLGEPLHVIIRGRLRLSCQGADPVEISGAHVTTWSEQVLFNQDAFELTMDDEQGGEAGLPLLGGVVLTNGLSVRIAQPQPEPEPEPERQAEPEVEPEPEPVNLAEGRPTLRPEEPAADSSTGSASGAPTALIDSVPWRKQIPEADHDGHTVMSSELRDNPEPPVEDADHDGHTVMRSNLPQSPAGSTGETGIGTAGRPVTGPVVLGRMCPQDHANPPTNSHCCICGSPISSEPGQIRRPSLGRMRISTGDVIELDRSVVIGRQPSAARVAGNGMPRLVQVKGEDGDISRSHLEVQLEGWHVMLRDLHSTNGTFLIRPGQSPRRLVPGEQTMLLDGDTAEIGDQVTIQFEDLQ